MPRGGAQRSGPGQRSCSGGRQQAGGLYSRRIERDHTQRGGEGCSPPSGAPWGPTSSRPGRGRERARGLQRRGWKGGKKASVCRGRHGAWPRVPTPHRLPHPPLAGGAGPLHRRQGRTFSLVSEGGQWGSSREPATQLWPTRCERKSAGRFWKRFLCFFVFFFF